MADNESGRKPLREAEGRIFDLLSSTLTPKEWKEFLKIPLERAAGQGEIYLADNLVGAGAEFGSALHEAVRIGHDAMVNKLTESGSSPRDRNAPGLMPLYVAAGHGKLEMVLLILLKGADNDALDNDGWSPLYVAVYHNRAEVVEALLAAGVDASLRCGRYGNSPLHLATERGYLEILKILIDPGAEVDATSRDGRTALHRPAFFNNAEAIGMLVEAGSNIEAENKSGCRPLHDAAPSLRLEATPALLRHGHTRTGRAGSSTCRHCTARRLWPGLQARRRWWMYY